MADDFMYGIKQQNIEGIIPEFDMAIDDENYQNGVVLLEQGELVKAGELLMQAHIDNPDMLQPVYALAKASYLVDSEKALSDMINKLAMLGQNDAEACFVRGWLLRWQGKSDDAIEAFRDALKIDPSHEKSKDFIKSTREQILTEKAEKEKEQEIAEKMEAAKNIHLAAKLFLYVIPFIYVIAYTFYLAAVYGGNTDAVSYFKDFYIYSGGTFLCMVIAHILYRSSGISPVTPFQLLIPTIQTVLAPLVGFILHLIVALIELISSSDFGITRFAVIFFLNHGLALLIHKGMEDA